MPLRTPLDERATEPDSNETVGVWYSVVSLKLGTSSGSFDGGGVEVLSTSSTVYCEGELDDDWLLGN